MDIHSRAKISLMTSESAITIAIDTHIPAMGPGLKGGPVRELVQKKLTVTMNFLSEVG